VKAVQNRKGMKPLMVVCKTVKGKGVTFMENVPIWHYRSPNPSEYLEAVNEIKVGLNAK
jgi:transketolase